MRTLSTALISTLTFLTLTNGASASEAEKDASQARPSTSTEVRQRAIKDKYEEEKRLQALLGARDKLTEAETVVKPDTDSPTKGMKKTIADKASQYQGAAEKIDSAHQDRMSEVERKRFEEQEMAKVALRDVSMVKEFANIYESTFTRVLELEEQLVGLDATIAKGRLESLLDEYKQVCKQFGGNGVTPEIKGQLSEYHGFLSALIDKPFWTSQFGQAGVKEFKEKLGADTWK